MRSKRTELGELARRAKSRWCQGSKTLRIFSKRGIRASSPSPASPFCAKQRLKPLPSLLSLPAPFPWLLIQNRWCSPSHAVLFSPSPLPQPFKKLYATENSFVWERAEQGKAGIWQAKLALQQWKGEGLECSVSALTEQGRSIRDRYLGTGAWTFKSSAPHKCFLITGRGKKEGDSPGIRRRPQQSGDGMDRTLFQQLFYLPLSPVTVRYPRSAKAQDWCRAALSK